MQNSLPYLDILIFGVIAVFLIFRLKNILGTKTGYDSSGAEKDNKSSNIIPLKPVEKNEKYNLISNDLDKIKEIDQTFNADEFLSGSRTFFKMVLESYILKSYENNLRNILVITGKGLNNQGVLKKEVPVWLEEKKIKNYLISFEKAPNNNGGSGALLLRIRNKYKF